MKKHAAPAIAAILLLLPMLYVGSYCELADPVLGYVHYRIETEDRWVEWFFRPLERIDRKLRPKTFEAVIG